MVHQAADRNHSQPAVLQLRKCQPLALRRVLAKSERVEPKVSGLARAVRKHVDLGQLALVHVELEETAEEKDLQKRLRADLEEGLDAVGLRIEVTGEADELLDDEAQEGEHGHSAWGDEIKRERGGGGA